MSELEAKEQERRELEAKDRKRREAEAAATKFKVMGREQGNQLPQFCRYDDLESAGIFTCWEQAGRLIDKYGFPPGRLITPNTRVWEVQAVNDWIATRPTARKLIPPAPTRIPPRKRKRLEAEAGATEMAREQQLEMT
jgi:hypothetical protein